MTGTVYLRTNRFEVKLEAITFKTKDFESMCSMDFLFPEGKVWVRPPIVGLDVMRHPRDPSVLLVLLCFGVGCVILKFMSGERLPPSVHKFFSDKRIHFVGFGIPEKEDLFPFEELGLTKSKVDIGYLAAKVLKDPKYKQWELSELARKVIGIKRMIGLTEASSFERHEQIKCEICQLFITSIIAMGLLGATDKKKTDDANDKKNSDKKKTDDANNKKNLDACPKKRSFLKNLNVHQLAEGWLKLNRGKKKNQKANAEEEKESIHVHIGDMDDMFSDNILVKAKREEGRIGNCLVSDTILEEDPEDDSFDMKVKESWSSNDLDHADGDQDGLGMESTKDKEEFSPYDSNKEIVCMTKTTVKGILKCPSAQLQRSDSAPFMPASTPSTPRDQTDTIGALKRANSKGCNVRFTCE